MPPRIRSIKPEHKYHRKVGRLTDRQYRLWIGLITEADDDGRLVADPAQLRALVFGYKPRVHVEHVVSDLQTLASVGLVQRYDINRIPYVHFPSWRDHQRLDRCHYTPSKLPEYNELHDTGSLPVDDLESTGSEGSGSGSGSGRDLEGNSKSVGHLADAPTHANGHNGHSEIPPKLLEAVPEIKNWPDVAALVALWNYHATLAQLPVVQTLSDRRRERAKRLLRQFPDWQYWQGSFAMLKRSKFLSGLVAPTNGHSKTFKADFDWILANSKRGTENLVEVYEGRYER